MKYLESNTTGTPLSSQRKKKALRSLKELFLIALLIFAALWSTQSLFNQESQAQKALPAKDTPDLLSVTFLDVWQGDSALIRSPSGKTMLIDGGQAAGKYSTFDGGKDVIIPYLKEKGIKTIDYMVMSHAHADHMGGLVSTLDAVKVKTVIDPGMPYGSRLYKRFLSKIEALKVPWKEAKQNDVYDLGGQVFAQIMGPRTLWEGTRSDPNNNSVVIKLIYHKTSFLFTGDIEAEAEYDLLDYGLNLRSNVLKVPHHGGEFSSTEEFVRLVKPDIAVISVGKKNKFGHPNPDTLQRYTQEGAKIVRTDLCGTITVLSDGKRISLSTQKECL